jgi:glycosyltransferase involved in cell wall biosynthesis
MDNLVDILRAAQHSQTLTGALIRQLRFLWELIAHRAIIRRYKSTSISAEYSPNAETPLLIGYFETGFGLGEYARGLAAALDAVNVPFAIYPYSAFTGRARDEAPWARYYDVEKIHPINIFCLATDQTRNARRIIGKRHTEKSYNILSTFWELPRAPKSALPDLAFFDELWTPSHFVADSFRPIFSKKILVMPPCINVNAQTVPQHELFGLDPKKFYFLFVFDLNSYAERKNPLAVLRAFEAAFGDNRNDVGLIFKITGTRNRSGSILLQLETAASRDARITIFHGDWQRTQVIDLFASIDCFVSLHRSEGFGLGMAEAMSLGKPVIGTAYSGNIEYLTAQTGFPVPYRLRPVREGEYPHAMDNSWAEPDERIAAELMRLVASKSDGVDQIALQGKLYVRQHYDPVIVGRTITARLQEIARARS